MPYPWSAHDILTASDLNAAISTGIMSTGLGAWTSYTPVWSSAGTAVSLGNGTLTGAYAKVGRIVNWRFALTMGSTTTYGTSNYFISLPVAAITLSTLPLCGSLILDSSAGTRYSRQGHLWTTTTALFASEAGTVVGQLAPMTWAVGDTWIGSGMYESAT